MLQKTSATTSIFGLSQESYHDAADVNPLGISIWHLHPRVWLPHDFSTFIRFLLVIITLGAGSAVNIYLSTQVLDAQVTQRELATQYQEIQRLNSQIVWEISHHVSIENVQQRSLALGFTPRQEHSYSYATVSEEKLASALEAELQKKTPASASPSEVSQLTLTSPETVDSFAQKAFSVPNEGTTKLVMAQVRPNSQFEEAAPRYFWSSLRSFFYQFTNQNR